MFNDKTLFILGAGASWYYGYPLGKDLILAINHTIDSEYVYAPLTMEQKSHLQFNSRQISEMTFSLHDMAQNLKDIDLKNLTDKDEEFVQINSGLLALIKIPAPLGPGLPALAPSKYISIIMITSCISLLL